MHDHGYWLHDYDLHNVLVRLHVTRRTEMETGTVCLLTYIAPDECHNYGCSEIQNKLHI